METRIKKWENHAGWIGNVAETCGATTTGNARLHAIVIPQPLTVIVVIGTAPISVKTSLRTNMNARMIPPNVETKNYNRSSDVRNNIQLPTYK